MASAPRSFRRAVKKQAERPTVTFALDRTDDEYNVIESDIFHATQPTDERLFLIAAMVGDEDAVGSEATATLELLRDSLPPDEYRTLRRRLADPDDQDATLEVVQEVIEWLMEQWTAFPTQPSSDSSTSQTPSGTKSTGRAPGRGSTRSTSPSHAS